MDLSSINWLAVIVAAFSSFMLGGLWYSPVLFARQWLAASGVDEAQAKVDNMAVKFGIAFVWSLLGAACFAMFIGPNPDLGFAVAAGAATGFFWITGSYGINYQFERRPMSLLAINGGYHVAQYTIYGLILGLWH
jgi:hypothetical protein